MLIKVESPVLGLGAYRRNVIINGDFCIAQRAVGALSTSWSWAHCDRWQAAASGTGVAGVLQQGANGKGIKRLGLFSYGTSFTAGTIAFRQRIESSFSMALRGNVFTAKAWIYHDHTAAMDFQFVINYPTVQDNWTAESTLFTGPSVSIPSGVVTEMTYTFPVLPDDATGWSGLSLIIRSVGNITVSNKTIGITNVQLESGPQSTKFENLPIGEVRALCERYYETGSFYHDSALNTVSNVKGSRETFRVRKYKQPTITKNDASASVADDITWDSFRSYNTSTTAITFSWTAEAEL